MRAFAAVLTLTTVLLACGGEAGDEAQESATQVAVGGGIDFERTAGHILDQLGLQAGERVLLVGVPGRFDGLVQPLRDGITVHIVQRRGKVAVVDDKTVASPQDLLGHLVHSGDV